MKRFIFKQNNIVNKTIDNNGWFFKFRIKGNFGFFSLKTPIMKEITYSEGPTVRYQRRHYVYGIGTIHSNKEFSGLAIFDPFIRMLIFPIVLFGVVNVSLDVFDAVVFASLFYLLILFLSSEDDNTLLDQCKSMFEAKH